MTWFAELIQSGRVNRADVGIEEDEGPSEDTNGESAGTLVQFTIPAINELNRHSLRPAWYSTKWTIGDGNCMFHAFATAMGNRRQNVQPIRNRAVDWITNNRDQVESFISDEENGSIITFEQYIDKMRQDRVWGDAICLHALARSHNVFVKVLKKTIEGEYLWLSAGDPDSNGTIHLYWESEHYENLIGAADVAGL